MSRSLFLRAATSYRAPIQRKIAVRHKWFGSDEEYTTDVKTNASNGNTKDFKKLKDEANLKSKGIWAKVIEKKNEYSTVGDAYFWKVITKCIDKRFQALETPSSDGTQTLRVISLSKDEVKYRVPMPGLNLDECSYEWDAEGLLLTICGDNEEYEHSYTPEVPRRFRYGNVTFDSLTMGMLIVSVKAKGYYNPQFLTHKHSHILKLSRSEFIITNDV